MDLSSPDIPIKLVLTAQVAPVKFINKYMNGSFRKLPSFQVNPLVDLLYGDSTPGRYY